MSITFGPSNMAKLTGSCFLIGGLVSFTISPFIYVMLTYNSGDFAPLHIALVCLVLPLFLVIYSMEKNLVNIQNSLEVLVETANEVKVSENTAL
jgi:hypothetical protein